MHGPAPKPASQRRRTNKPGSYGDAEPVTAPAAASGVVRDLNIGVEHPFITQMWAALQQSCEQAFWSEADWQRARMELWHMNQILTGAIKLTAASWQQVQTGLGDLLISPAAKRRAGIEMRKPRRRRPLRKRP
jgi:hypothetical protein